MESEMARNYRKKAEYQKTQSGDIDMKVVTSPVKQQQQEPQQQQVEEESGSEYSYFTESDEEGEEGAGPSSDMHRQRAVFTQQDLHMIQRT